MQNERGWVQIERESVDYGRGWLHLCGRLALSQSGSGASVHRIEEEGLTILNHSLL